MSDDPKGAPCLGCDKSVLPGLDVCLACGARPLYQSLKEGEYAVEAGPIAGQRFRDATVALLDQVLDRPLKPEAVQRLAAERVRVCQNLEKPYAEALTKKLGRQESNAQVVTGAAPERGAIGGFAKPWPWLAAIVGIALAPFVGWWMILLGIGAAVGLAFSVRKERMPVLGDAPFPPQAWAPWSPVARRAADLLAALDGPARERFAAVTSAVRDLLERLAADDAFALASGGREGNMGKAAVRLLEETVEAGERVRDAKDAAAADALGRLAETARKAREDVFALGRTLDAPAERMAAQVEQEVQQLSQRVAEHKRIWTR